MDEIRSDSEVIRASWDDPELFGEIIERHYDVVYRYVARRIGRQDARDVTAEVFLNAFAARNRFDTDAESARPWLFGIAFNLIGRRLRTIRRRQRLTEALPGLRPVEDLADDSDSRLAASEVAAELWEALDSLAESDRETFLLYAVDGLTYSEVAEVLSIALGTVASRISRVRSLIREAIPDLKRRTNGEGYPNRGPSDG